ncbi:hypothetical protein MMC29_003928, partial [Sticta canariensis]|nr:hypothetical protein [Sticta canariensis]
MAQDFETGYRDADIIVDQQSATLHGRRMMFLTTDHSGLNKFRGPKDPNFRLVGPEIERMIRTAPSEIEAHYSSHPLINEKLFRISFSLEGIPVVNKFVERNAEMNQLEQELLPALMRRRVFVLHGLGGIGKTQLSVEFARKNQKSYSAVFWINSSTKEILRQNIADLARRLPQEQVSRKSKSYLEGKSSNIDEVVNEVLEWLSRPSNDQWLLIYDNVDREFSISSEDPEAFDIKLYFPKADQGSILVTTRLESLRRLGADLKLEPVDELQGAIILRNSIGNSVEDSIQLIKLLQGLPLAINQAGSYMRETNTNVAEYIKSYNHAWKRLMRPREDADASVLTTWTLSFDRLRAQSQEAANLLLLWAFLDNQDLWYGLFAPALNQEIFEEMPDWFVKCAADEFDFKDRIGLLLKYSFINAKTESSSFSVHPVFHNWCFHAFEEDKAVMSRLAIIIVASAAPSDTMPHYTLTQRRLLPHCDRIFSLVQQRMQKTLTDEINFHWQSDAYHMLGHLYSHQDKMKEAENLYLRALAGKEKAWGAEHTSTLETVNNLAILYSVQGKMNEAEKLYLRALAGFEKAWGAEHTSTLETVNNLANLYKRQGKMREAEKLYLRALAGFEKAWGAEHTSTLDTVNNLANLYKRQGKMREAEKLYLRALAGKEKAWGAEHTLTLSTVNNLASLYSDQGRMNEAEKLYLRALAGFEKAWGAEHTSTLETVNNLANLYQRQGKMREAEKL